MPRPPSTLALACLLTACAAADAPTAVTTAADESSTGTSTTPPAPTTGPTPLPDPAPTTTTTTTTDDLTTDAPDLPPNCGDGRLDAGEACDLGLDNSDKGYCKLDCTVATCGDGDLWVGVEACDDGSNLGEYAGCNPDCTLANFCGDGVPHPNELCDAGDANGTGGSDGLAPCSLTCDLEARLVFISSVAYTGDLGGLSGADLRCQNLAKAAGNPRWQRFHAWLSDASTAAATRFPDADPPLPLANIHGKLIADSLADLIAAGPGDGIALDELGNPTTGEWVWTNTAVTGQAFSQVDHCAGWISASLQLVTRVGLNSAPAGQEEAWSLNKAWTSHATRSCAFAHRVYCLEVLP